MIDNPIQTLVDLGVEAQITTRKSNNTTSQNNKIKRIKYNQTCPRFATMDHLRITGLGNKITEVIFGMILAERTNATYIYDEDIWHYAGSHGDYAWFPAGFLPLQNVEVTQQDLNRWKKEQVQLQVHEEKIQRIDGTWDQVIESSRNISCHVEFHTRFDQCCSTDESENDSNNNTSNYHHHRHPNYCFCTMSKSLNGAFESIKWRLREVYYSQSNYTAPKDLSELLPQYNNNNNNNVSNALIPPRIVTIVWHIRVGDVVLHKGKIDYFERIFAQIKESFEKANNHKHQHHDRNVTQIIPHIFFLGEGGKDIILQSFPFLPEMCRKYIYSSNSESINIKQDIIDPNPCSYPVMDVRETLYHMIHSNILITSGSSFASVAALLRINDNNSTTTSSMSTTGIHYNKQLITLDALPKEGEEARGIYSVSESFQIDQDGNIQQIELLETLLEKWD